MKVEESFEESRVSGFNEVYDGPGTVYKVKLTGGFGDRRRIEKLSRKIRRLIRKEKRGK